MLLWLDFSVFSNSWKRWKIKTFEYYPQFIKELWNWDFWSSFAFVFILPGRRDSQAQYVFRKNHTFCQRHALFEFFLIRNSIFPIIFPILITAVEEDILNL